MSTATTTRPAPLPRLDSARPDSSRPIPKPSLDAIFNLDPSARRFSIASSQDSGNNNNNNNPSNIPVRQQWTVAEDDKHDVFVFHAGRNSSCARLGLRPFLNIRNITLVCPCIFAATIVLVVFLTYTNTGLAAKSYNAATWERTFGESTKHPGTICEQIGLNQFIARPVNAAASWAYVCASCFAFLLFTFDVDARIRIAPTQADMVRNITKAPKALVLLVRQPIWTFLFGIYFMLVAASSFWYYLSVSYTAFKVNAWTFGVVNVHFVAYSWSRFLLEGMPTGHRDSQGCCGLKGIACTMTVEDRAGLEFTVSFMAIVFTVFLNIILYVIVEYVDESVSELVFFVLFWMFALGVYFHWWYRRKDVDVFFAPLGWALIAGGCAYLCKYSDKTNCTPQSSLQANAAWQFGSAFTWLLALLFFRGDRPAMKNLVVMQDDDLGGGETDPLMKTTTSRKSGAPPSSSRAATGAAAAIIISNTTSPSELLGQKRVSSSSAASTPVRGTIPVPPPTNSASKRASVVEVDLEASTDEVQVVDRTKDRDYSAAPLPPSNPPSKDMVKPVNSMSTVATSSTAGGGSSSSNRPPQGRNSQQGSSTVIPPVGAMSSVTRPASAVTPTRPSSNVPVAPPASPQVTVVEEQEAPRERVPSLEDHIQMFLAKKRDSGASLKSTTSNTAPATTATTTKVLSTQGVERRDTLESVGGGAPRPGQSRRRVSSVDSQVGLSRDQTAALRVLTHENASQRTLENERTATGVGLDMRTVSLRSPEEAREAAISAGVIAFTGGDVETSPAPSAGTSPAPSPRGSVLSADGASLSTKERLAALKAERARVAELAARQLT